MSDERTRQIGRNEALYRSLNERIEEIAVAEQDTVATGPIGTFEIVCECGRLDCMETLVVPIEVYERTRAAAVRFLVKPGHEEPDLATVVEATDGYLVTEKNPRDARRIAEMTDPRS
jgi:hypothetical protein